MKLQRKWISVLLMLVVVLVMCMVVFTACDSNDTTDDDDFDEHQHTLETDDLIVATCTKKGLTSGVHCSECGEILVPQQETEKLEHSVVIDPAVPATYESEGLTEGSHCSRCGIILVPQQVVSKLERPTVPVECPEVHSKEVLDGVGISYVFISEHKPVKCGDQSYNLYQCDNCGKYFAGADHFERFGYGGRAALDRRYLPVPF